MMLESSGFEAIDLSVDVDKNLFQTTLQENPIRKSSAALPCSRRRCLVLKETVAMLNDQPNSDFSVMTGGARSPMISQRMSARIIYSPDAAGAAQTAKAAV